jgi:glutathione S-transferase
MGSGASRGPKPKLYIFSLSAPCRAVLMAAKAANIALDIEHVDLLKGEQNSSDFLKLNPDHTVPTLDDHGFHLWESRAIMIYLVDKYANGHEIYPKDLVHRAQINRYLFYDVSSIDGHIGKFVRPQAFQQQPADAAQQQEVEKAMDYLDEKLKEKKYLVGEKPTIADFSIVASTSMLELVDWQFDRWNNVHEWRQRIKELPFYEEVNKPLHEFVDKRRNQQEN